MFTPLLGETIDLTVETSIFQVTLSDPLMSSLAFQAVKDVELCWVDARLRKRKLRSVMEFSEMTNELADVEIIEDGEEAAKEDEAMDVDDGSQFTPKPIRLDTVVQGEQLCLEILPSNTVPSHEAVFVNDPKLSDLRIYLSKQGFNAEFSAGVLYVNDTLKISRNSTGQFNYEGPANEEYYSELFSCLSNRLVSEIREAVYSQFAIV